ncbi:MAG: shikimate dehydrogenase [Mitsuaria chitosanitabida]|uniref:shikimate dehydrogenase n=1 Tax=Roseateles chitosanitabidus TaxID=65048 RepID=UPI001B063A58|nr:shikimate dehydrogenase [Roseateles chitosanitabidus]MBO9689220.1 shikimate dehydrogenase [Roseateles chitosanitabidus]
MSADSPASVSSAAAALDRYAVAGNPVAHSRSPEIHAAFAAQTGQSLVYERLLCPLDAFEATIRGFVAAGARGCNVTVPFKFEAFRLAQRLTPRARLAGAVNTLRFDAEAAGGWLGDNTDGAGLVADIERNAARPLRGQRVLLIGAGGASAGVLGSLIAARPAAIRVVNRSPDKALALIDSHRAWADEHGVVLSAGPLDAAAPGGPHEVLINGTSASLSGAGVPLPETGAPVLARGGLAVDMMYGPSAAAFLDWADAQSGPGGARRDGLGMLVEQAAEAFLVWRGVRPDSASVLADVRRRLESAA